MHALHSEFILPRVSRLEERQLLGWGAMRHRPSGGQGVIDHLTILRCEGHQGSLRRGKARGVPHIPSRMSLTCWSGCL